MRALGSLALMAGGRRRPDAGDTANRSPDTGAAPSTTPLDPTKVVPADNSDSLDLLRDVGDEIKLSDEKLVTRRGARPGDGACPDLTATGSRTPDGALLY